MLIMVSRMEVMLTMISLDLAKKAVDAAMAKAQETGIAVSVAVVDEHGTLVCLSRMDGALPVSVKFATVKAATAGMLGMQTAQIAQFAVPGKPFNGLDSLLGGELTTIAGGVPVMLEGKLAGGIGVGGSADLGQDVSCAEAAVKAIS